MSRYIDANALKVSYIVTSTTTNGKRCAYVVCNYEPKTEQTEREGE